LDEQNTVCLRTPVEENKAHKNWKIKIRTYHFDAAAAARGRCLRLIGHWLIYGLPDHRLKKQMPPAKNLASLAKFNNKSLWPHTHTHTHTQKKTPFKIRCTAVFILRINTEYITYRKSIMRLFPKSYHRWYFSIIYIYIYIYIYVCIKNLCQPIVYIHATIHSHLLAQFTRH